MLKVGKAKGRSAVPVVLKHDVAKDKISPASGISPEKEYDKQFEPDNLKNLLREW